MAAKRKRTSGVRRKNPVARYAARFQKAATHKDRKKASRRGESRYRRQSLDD